MTVVPMHTRKEKLEAFGRLLDLMDNLRQRCPWNAAQTMESIRPMTEEEVYELSDEIVKGNMPGVAKEIGDLLYHMVFYARIAEEKGEFDVADSIDRICAKMIFRHPHVFRQDGSLVPEGEAPSAKEIADTWELVKAKEKDGNKTVMSGIPDAMPAVLKAMSMQEKARGCGFDWEEREDVWDKVQEELGELREALAGYTSPLGDGTSNESQAQAKLEVEGELGDFIFSVVNAARLYHLNPDSALEMTDRKFIRRFTYLENRIKSQGKEFKEMTLAQMDEIWNEAKALEREGKLQ